MAAATPDAIERRASFPLVRRDGGVLVDVEHVELVMRYVDPFGRRHLRGADVHPPVELERVGIDHLRGQPARERQRKVGLPHRGRSDDGDDGRLRRRPVALIMHVSSVPGAG